MENPLSELSPLEKHTLKMLKVLEDYLALQMDVPSKLAAAKKLAVLLGEFVELASGSIIKNLQGSVDTMARAALMRALGQGADLAASEQVGLEGQLAQSMFSGEELDPQEQLCAIIDPLLLAGKAQEAVERVSELTGWTLDESAVVVRGRQEQLIQSYEQTNAFGQPLEGLPLEGDEEAGKDEVSPENGGDPPEQRGEGEAPGGA